ncbi:MAG: hypothetical protein PHN53_10765 [Eubacteriales bacterium]|nr:hypothetical protein [Eubacteriales bacterium]
MSFFVLGLDHDKTAFSRTFLKRLYLIDLVQFAKNGLDHFDL